MDGLRAVRADFRVCSMVKSSPLDVKTNCNLLLQSVGNGCILKLWKTIPENNTQIHLRNGGKKNNGKDVRKLHKVRSCYDSP